MDEMEILELDNKYSTNIYTMKNIAIARGKGTELWDVKGKKYLDFGINYGVSNVGHCNSEVINAIKEQAEKLIFIGPSIYNEQRSRLFQRLAEITPENLVKSFITNSGTEAVEAALKFSKASTKRTEIISTKRAFHGRTMAALSTTWKKKYREPFQPLFPGCSFVTYNDTEAVKETINENTSCIILEPIQGEGGVHIPDKKYLTDVKKICQENGTFLILDEVQTGFGRTGKMFACEHFDVQPDIMCVAKSLGGGFPIGACILADDVEIIKFSHGSTFGGNPLACAAANASIDFIIRERLCERSKKMGDFFMDLLNDLNSPKIREIRGLGLMIGIELKQKSGKYLSLLLENGIIALPAGNNVIRFLPPLTIEREEIEFVVDTLKEVLKSG